MARRFLRRELNCAPDLLARLVETLHLDEQFR
jgi:hypothetical protein